MAHSHIHVIFFFYSQPAGVPSLLLYSYIPFLFLSTSAPGCAYTVGLGEDVRRRTLGGGTRLGVYFHYTKLSLFWLVIQIGFLLKLVFEHGGLLLNLQYSEV